VPVTPANLNAYSQLCSLSILPLRKGQRLKIRKRPLKCLDVFCAYIKKEIVWFRGRQIEKNGRGPLATFDGPARGIRCACTISEYASRLGIVVRTSLHTGECDLLENDGVGGVTVEIGQRIMNAAQGGEVLVSHTVKDLIAGSGIRFGERGTTTFTDIPGQWRLYKVECASCP